MVKGRRRARYAPGWIELLKALVAAVHRGDTVVTQPALLEALEGKVSPRVFDKHFSRACQGGILIEEIIKDGNFVPVGTRKSGGRGRPQKMYLVNPPMLMEALVHEFEGDRIRARIGTIAKSWRLLIGRRHGNGTVGLPREWVFVRGEEQSKEDVNARILRLKPEIADVDTVRYSLRDSWEKCAREFSVITWLVHGDDAMVVMGPALEAWIGKEMTNLLDAKTAAPSPGDARELAEPRSG